MKTFRHVGCGPKRKDQTTRGFDSAEWNELRPDIDEAVNPDIVGTMPDMSAVADASVKAVFSSHNIEHLYPREVPKALAEFRRVLKPEGFAQEPAPDVVQVGQSDDEQHLGDLCRHQTRAQGGNPHQRGDGLNDIGSGRVIRGMTLA